MNNPKQNRGRHRNSARRSNPSRQNFDSRGHGGIRIRGNATQVYEKYIQLARDAQGSGDRVVAENMLQHAEHYYRLLNEGGSDRHSSRQQMQTENPGQTDQPEIRLDETPPGDEAAIGEAGSEEADPRSQPTHRGRGRRSNSYPGPSSGRGRGRGRRPGPSDEGSTSSEEEGEAEVTLPEMASQEQFVLETE